ncbi:MAG: protein kinase [Acidobacteriota bacterium]|nr:protein kinase [Acidobacteriota bacterium]
MSALGAGGMGEVYRARDTKLNRDVAIKVLLPAVANDPDRLARFGREAQVLASLNHPNIAHIHGLEESGGITALVLELVEGEDLAQRIARGPIPLDEALPIARQIAEALEAAHDHGIIHRDLKPANIKVRPDGTVKVLDFGLAKAIDSGSGNRAPGSADAMNSPTLSIHATAAGVILGTAAYMSPEQARGRFVDKRSDIWSLGCVLFEMLTGRRPFAGDDATDTIVAVVSKDPDWSTLPRAVPAGIHRVLRRSLEKDPKRRLDSAATVRIEIDDAQSAFSSSAGVANAADARSGWHLRAGGSTSRTRERIAWLAAVCALGAAAIVLALRTTPLSSDAPPVHFTIAPPTHSPEAWNASVVSPDGRRVLFGGAFILGTGNQLWVRSLDTLEARPLAGTTGVNTAFWSPDGRTIAFFDQGKLKKLDVVSAAPPLTICDAPNASGGTWNRDGVILFTTGDGALARVAASGGQPEPVVALDRSRGHTAYRSPWFLPDGTHFIYFAQPENAEYVGALQSSDQARLIEADSPAQYAPPGYLVFGRGGALLAQPFDAARRRIVSEPVMIADHVTTPGARMLFSVSDNDVLIYRTSTAAVTQLAWFDRTGKPLGTMGESATYREFVLSRAGDQVIAERVDAQSGKRGIWQIDVARGISTRLTPSSDNEENMIVSPDGTALVYASDGKDGLGIFHKLLAGGAVTTLLQSAERKWPEDWSSDGRYIVSVNATHRRLEILPMFGDRKPFVFLDAPAFKDEPQFSPDVQWLAYVADESGRYEIYVERFPQAGDKLRLSSEGGGQPQWRRDGKELFYLALDGTLTAVAMRNGRPIGVPSPLFHTRINVQPLIHQYAVTADGQRFLMITPVGETTSPFHVLINWTAGLKR